jgi:hypothetical protein
MREINGESLVQEEPIGETLQLLDKDFLIKW